ncbi:MAG TPA: glycogen debranching protein GlgX [Gemmatimonadales bacterium]|nr:glycogen debranching protein GlgX [Gemmatimonadales bacterium]
MLPSAPAASPPLGAIVSEAGATFALYSAHATAVELCLFANASDAVETRRVPLLRGEGNLWHATLPGIGPGQLYGYRVQGPWAPALGHYFNPAKLLLDPYARALTGPVAWHPALATHPEPIAAALADRTPDPRDSAGVLPKCIVVDPAFDWRDDAPPRTPWDRTVIYECHVKGMTKRHPEVPERLRGTYLGLSSEPVVRHLRELGVTAVELLPVHQEASEPRLARLGLTNYWGYSTIGYFAPDIRFASGGRAGGQVAEFQQMVCELHAAGLEVLLDVVYNHTAEGGAGGPTLAFRGIDNRAYYRLDPEDPARYVDVTGCGNTVDLRAAPALDLALDSLRYWVEHMHVDGFRFDIAPVLGRTDAGFDPRAPFFERVRQDPVLSTVKLIAEPWDLGPDGYQVGSFPAGWAEWNGKYRDTVRRFWRGDTGRVPELASRVAGSSDIYGPAGRGPLASVNFVTCHDGFTLYDLVSYERKHNAANGEDNRDGTDHNLSRNWGAEGPPTTTQIARVRERVKRSFLATLACSQGVPMLSHGDELGRSQQGNNNAYCHDSPLTWLSWELDENARALLAFTRRMFALRAATPELRRRTFFPQSAVDGDGLTWLRSDGARMTPEDWAHDSNHVLGMWFDGPDPMLLLMNGGGRSRPFTLPRSATPWRVLVDTSHDGERPAEGAVTLAPHSLVLLRQR